ncbi:Sodium/hydrogen exchanger family-domain-containing protein [Suillus fuscotomentosus]|uniref:Sodium/hydrogen exchanger family-domain-containing protein n=1 Tax=Suillus fuscotomentosus TaxID=1912939 RepID=A0AAD4HKK0_9AGAM|nr:Sodium/hydrogen exchanger family-domain-containing protein [Suillus fuscotomentosus]KAG1901080.1 Sodium/hydrogen exchanger family-domain-containing protein [Suillus fuscotomentosus]
MPEFSDTIINLFDGLKKRQATGEGGLLTGSDPSAFDVSDPLRLWIIQVGVIIMLDQLLSLGLGRMKQPKVIAEVLGGILLGPTAFGRIPGFTQHIFPSQSLPYLSLVANIGLCLFLFIVGLEIDASVIKRNARMSAIVSLAGMALPFGLGSALSVPLYHHFIDPSVQFTHFMLFTGVAYSITAFPVLCRILTELKLLDTTVGIVVLSAGVGNDVVGWTLLALSVALVNAGSGLTALWVLLTCVAFTIFLLLVVKRVMLWLARATGSTDDGPTMFYMTVVMILLWACAFFTDIVGVNAIFGAFLAGIIVPREGGLAIALTEKLEDMVTIIFLPLYFTLSGLNTNLGLLDDGITWAFTIAIACLAFLGKFGGCTIASRLSGFSWREASTIGSLMSCKGLVELIVLNVGLSAGVLSPKVFSMFVLEALTLTFMTTPLVRALYPPERRVIATSGGAPPKTRDDEGGDLDADKKSLINEEQPWRYRFTLVLDKLEHMPCMMALTQLIRPPVPDFSSVVPMSAASDPAPLKYRRPEVSINALRLIELSDRASAVMKSSTADTLIHTDPLLGIFRMFGELNDLPVSSSLAIVPHDDLACNVVDHAKQDASQLILLPWLPPCASIAETSEGATLRREKFDHNPFEVIFGTSRDKSASAIHSQFVRGVFAQSETDVALFVDPGNHLNTGAKTGGSYHIFLPFFGGPDDRLALEFVVQLCTNPRISATVVKMEKREIENMQIERPSTAHSDVKVDTNSLALAHQQGLTISSIIAFPDTVYGQTNTQMRMQSETADSIIWSRYAGRNLSDVNTTGLLRAALSRIDFTNLASPVPLHAAIQRASMCQRVLVVTGRSKRLAVEDHHAELKDLVEEHRAVGHEVMSKTIGDVATAFVVSGCPSAVVVLQAANVEMH